MINLLVRNTSINIVTEAVTSVFAAALFMVASRMLGPEGIGIFSLAMTVGAIWGQLPTFGFEKLISRDIGRETERASHYYSHICSTKIIFTLIAMVGVLVNVYILHYSSLKTFAVLIVSFSVFLFSFISFFSSFFRAFQRAEYEAYLRILLRMGNLILGLAALYLGTGLLGLAFSQTIVAVIAVFLGLYYLKKNFMSISIKWNYAEAKDLVIRSSPFILLSILVLLYVSIGTLMLNIFKGDYDTGIYAAAGKLIQVMVFFPTAMTSAFLPIMSKLSAERDKNDQFVRIYNYAFKYLFMIGVAIATGFSVLSEPISIFLYGEEFVKSASPLMIMSWAMVFSFLNFIMVNTIIALGKEKLLLYVSAGGVVLNVMFNLWAIPKYGYDGAAASTLITETSVFFAHYIIIRPFLGTQFKPYRLILKPIGAAVATSIVVFLTNSHIHLLFSIAIGAIVFISMLYFMKAFDPYERKLVKDLLSKHGSFA